MLNLLRVCPYMNQLDNAFFFNDTPPAVPERPQNTKKIVALGCIPPAVW